MNQQAVDPLINPAWYGLLSHQADLGRREGSAARYRPDVSVFAALETGADISALLPLLSAGDTVGLLSPEGAEIQARPPFEQIARIKVTQMVCHEPAIGALGPAGADLGPADNQNMLALALATDPGPFAINTRSMGRYVGVYEQGALVAMAGERFRLPGWTEISGVCTSEAARGKGLAKRLMVNLMQGIYANGDKAFLHVRVGSPSEQAALHAYAQLGFVPHQMLVGQIFRVS